MPHPDEKRGKFIKYLRTQLPHNKFWIDGHEVFPPEDVRKVILSIEDSDPALSRILRKYTSTRNSRSKIAESENYDASTIKRKLDHALDMVLQELNMMAASKRREIPLGTVQQMQDAYQITSVVPEAEASSELPFEVSSEDCVAIEQVLGEYRDRE